MISLIALSLLFGACGGLFVLFLMYLSHPIHEPDDYTNAAVYGALFAAGFFAYNLGDFL